MGAIHAGIIPQSCNKCERDPSLKCVWGCDKPSQVAVEVLPDDSNEPFEYFSCPVLFISPRVRDWYTRYTLIKEGIVSPKEYSKEDGFFIQATQYFKKWVNFYNMKKAGHG